MQNSQFNQCPQPSRHVVAKDLDAPIRAVRDQRKNRVVHTSHRKGRTSTIVRMVDSRSPVRLDRWILWLSQFGQLLFMGPLFIDGEFHLDCERTVRSYLSRLAQLSSFALSKLSKSVQISKVSNRAQTTFGPVVGSCFFRAANLPRRREPVGPSGSRGLAYSGDSVAIGWMSGLPTSVPITSPETTSSTRRFC